MNFYLEHMSLEESVILPEAERSLSEQDWAQLDAAFGQNADPLTGHYPAPAEYEKLFSLIVARAPLQRRVRRPEEPWRPSERVQVAGAALAMVVGTMLQLRLA